MADPMTAKPELVHCDACYTDVIASTVEPIVVEGQQALVCRDARACRRRAQIGGRWKVYP